MHRNVSFNKEYYHKDIVEVFPSINPRTLISWAEKDLLKPLAIPDNRGGKRVYNYKNLIEIAFIIELSSLGAPIHTIHRIMNDSIFNKALHKNYKGIFTLPYSPVTAISSKTGKRTQESRWSGRWTITSLPDVKFNFEGLSSVIIINIKTLKVYVDNGLR